MGMFAFLQTNNQNSSLTTAGKEYIAIISSYLDNGRFVGLLVFFLHQTTLLLLHHYKKDLRCTKKQREQISELFQSKRPTGQNWA